MKNKTIIALVLLAAAGVVAYFVFKGKGATKTGPIGFTDQGGLKPRMGTTPAAKGFGYQGGTKPVFSGGAGFADEKGSKPRMGVPIPDLLLSPAPQGTATFSGVDITGQFVNDNPF